MQREGCIRARDIRPEVIGGGEDLRCSADRAYYHQDVHEYCFDADGAYQYAFIGDQD